LLFLFVFVFVLKNTFCQHRRCRLSHTPPSSSSFFKSENQDLRLPIPLTMATAQEKEKEKEESSENLLLKNFVSTDDNIVLSTNEKHPWLKHGGEIPKLQFRKDIIRSTGVTRGVFFLQKEDSTLGQLFEIGRNLCEKAGFSKSKPLLMKQIDDYLISCTYLIRHPAKEDLLIFINVKPGEQAPTPIHIFQTFLSAIHTYYSSLKLEFQNS